MKKLLELTIIALVLTGCNDNKSQGSSNNENSPANIAQNQADNRRSDIGVGPITKVVLDETIDSEMAAEGEQIFIEKCSACHKTDKRYIGPNPTGILERRTPEWVMNMILNPDGMVKEDEAAKQLLIEYNGTPMANQNLTEEEARAILEFFRTL